METDENIKWVIANKKISFWNVFYFGIPLNFIVLYIIFYFIVFPYFSSYIFALTIYFVIAIVSSTLSSIIIYFLLMSIGIST